MSRRIPRGAAWVAAAAVVLAALVPLGRWERSRQIDAQLRQMTATYRAATAGGLAGPQLAAFRQAETFDCLLYRRGAKPFALEVCFDPQGRLVETIDRSGTTTKIGSLRPQPAATSIRVAPSRLLPVFERLGAFRGVSVAGGQIPVGFDDGGPTQAAAGG